MKHDQVPPPHFTALSGQAVVRYAEHDGRALFGEGEVSFETKWSGSSSTSIIAYNDPTSTRGIAVADGAKNLTDITRENMARLDFTSRTRRLNEGQFLVIENTHGRFLAVQVIDVMATSHGDPEDRLILQYQVVPTEREAHVKHEAIESTNRVQLLAPTIHRFGPNGDLQEITLPVSVGDRIFLLGSNGTGKSSFLQSLMKWPSTGNSVIRVAAHRQMWTQSGAMKMTAASRQEHEQNLVHWERQEKARFSDQPHIDRVQALLFDLVNEQVRLDQALAKYGREDPGSAQFRLARAEETPVDKLNRLLASAQLKITVKIDGFRAVQAQRNGGEPFDFAEVSDGERAAIFLAATVLISPPDSVLLLDEPERHLNHAIIAPLLRDLFAERPDCAMVVSTHAIDLAVEHPQARMILMRDVRRAGPAQQKVAWDFDLLEAGEDIPELIRRDILGSRRRVLFVEGTDASLDGGLYATLLPGVSVVPKGSSRDVIAATKGMRGASELHHIEVFGLIDHDGRDDEARDEHVKDRVYVLGLNAVEALYYHPDVIRVVALAQAEHIDGFDAADMQETAIESAVRELNKQRDRLCARAADMQLSAYLQRQAPTWEDVRAGGQRTILLDLDAVLKEEQDRFDAAVAQTDLETLLRRYKMRECNARGQVAQSLRFATYKDYEGAVRQQVRKNQVLCNTLLRFLGGLPNALGH
ncbi:AAA family ATPase [Pararhodobacter sp. CCB-MM2]|uniref:AAA family ATPase n=1 Tax=Pararhodobacter sp. CCB-MM2 TaxID=1786003 RepID=UPI0008328D45|nr:AAA family ATPase [Pararhodobacter sp. CCB-MM2]